jgi:hypothetical protein
MPAAAEFAELVFIAQRYLTSIAADAGARGKPQVRRSDDDGPWFPRTASAGGKKGEVRGVTAHPGDRRTERRTTAW